MSLEASVEADEAGDTLVITLRTTSQPDGVEIRLEPSKLLYAVDRTAYVELLAASVVNDSAKKPELDTGEDALLPSIQPQALPLRYTRIVAVYEGPLLPLKTDLATFMETLGGLESAVAGRTGLVDSLLAVFEGRMGLDWSERDALQAGIKVAIRRTLIKFDVEAPRAEATAERILAWLRTNKLRIADLKQTA